VTDARQEVAREGDQEAGDGQSTVPSASVTASTSGVVPGSQVGS
jgi:hypothetical protein